MPFTSQQQRKFMYSKHPKLAKEMESKTPKGKKLPNKMPMHKKMEVPMKESMERRIGKA